MATTLNFNGTLLDASQPLVMGIINLTTDSFFAPSRISNIDDAVAKAGEMLRQGAAILDLGAMSSRPGARISDPKDELNVLIPAITSILQDHPNAVLSVDTIHAEVAEKVILAGAASINDISAGTFDKNMLNVIASSKVPYFMMHMKGLPSDMQLKPVYNDVVDEILKFFVSRLAEAEKLGIKDIVIDPGFGFGKTIQHNYTLLKHLEVFNIFDLPVLVGVSRKSMIWKHLGISAENALNGTTALHMVALLKGANILRVHDVAEAMECIALFKAIHSGT